MLAHTRSYKNMSPVLKMASDPAILDAMDRSLAMRMAMVRVLQMAKSRQTSAFIKDRPTASDPALRPA